MASGLGPYCAAAGLTADQLKSGGLPHHMSQISNGLVVELARFGKMRKMDNLKVETWVSELVGHQDKELSSAIWQVFEKRKTLRKLRRSGELATLESAPFDPQVWPATVQQPEASVSIENLEHNSVNSDSVPNSNVNDFRKENNQLRHNILKKEGRLRCLTKKVKILEEELNVIKKKSGHYGVRNVNKRDARHQVKVSTLNDTIAVLEDESEKIKEQNSTLKREKVALQKKLHRVKKSNQIEDHADVCDNCCALEAVVKEYRDKINELGSLCESDRKIELKDDSGAYCENVRLCISELIGFEVSAGKAPEVIASVAKHIFFHVIDLKDLPGRSTCINMANEGAEVVRAAIAHKFETESGWGLHKDGTTRRKCKILDTTVRFQSGVEYSLGFSRVVSETGQAICDEAVKKVTVLKEHSAAPDTFITNVARSLTYFMSDRAANERKSNELLEAWRADQLQEDTNIPKVHNLYCMAHVLLGFHNYIVKDLQNFQKEISGDGSGRIGRHTEASSRSYKLLQAVSRVCCAASDIFAPVGDHLGLRDVWEAYCEDKGIKSLVQNYKDNRFNGLFQMSSAIGHHYDDMIYVLAKVKEPNQKIKGLLQDLKDSNVMIMVNVLGVVFYKITAPYWNLVTRSSYNNVVEPLRRLFKEIGDLLDQSTSLRLADYEFSSLSAFTDTSNILHLDDTISLSQDCIRTVLIAFRKCMSKQLSDILSPDGDALMDDRLQFAPSTNLNVERQFGHLDASQKRRPNANLHYHSTVISLKKNKNILGTFMSTMSSGKKAAFQIRIRYLARRRLRQQQAEELSVRKALLEKFSHIVKSRRARTPAEVTTSTSIDHLLPSFQSSIAISTWAAVAYPEAWYPGLVLLSSENATAFTIDFAFPRKSPGDFKWPNGQDKQHVARSQIIATDLPIQTTSNGRFFHVENHAEISKVFGAVQNNSDFFSN